MRTTKITLIGAGSTSFGLSTLQDIIAHADALRGSRSCWPTLTPTLWG